VDDLAIIIVSTNEAHWLTPCLRSIFDHAGDLSLDVVVADNESTDGTRELVEMEFPQARVVNCRNRGFSHANNQGWLTCDARYALFLNPDTEILSSTFADLVALMDERPTVGLAGVKQITPDGSLLPTIRRFPSIRRALGEALVSERWPIRPAWAGEREFDQRKYGKELEIDWTSGSFMLARREALLSAGILDERSFIYTEEPDLCLRMRKAGWTVVHLPDMTILHHAGKAGRNARMEAQGAFARLHYGRKHFSGVHRSLFVGALGLGYAVRAVVPARSEDGRARRAASRLAWRTLTGFFTPPFGDPPPTAVNVVSAEGGPRREILPAAAEPRPLSGIGTTRICRDIPSDNEARALAYAAITPVRNEEQNLQRLAGSMLRQTRRPASWIIVDNGSTDGTRAVAQDLARRVHAAEKQ